MKTRVTKFFRFRVRGFNLAETLALGCLIILMLIVYLVKTRAGVETAQITDLNRQIADESREVRRLRDAVGRLESPSRLERLSQHYLALAPLSARQEAAPEDLAEIARHTDARPDATISRPQGSIAQ